VGFGGAGFIATGIPEITESSIEKFKFDRQERGDPSFTEKQELQIREVISDKGSALFNMAFAFGSVIAPVLGGAFT
jgi:hypothetical protein